MLRRTFSTDDKRREHIHNTLDRANANLNERWVEELVKRDIVGSYETSVFTLALAKLDDQAIERRFQALTLFPFLLSAFGEISRMRSEAKGCRDTAENDCNHLPEKLKKTFQEKQYEEAKSYEEKAQKIEKLFQSIDDGERLTPALVEFAHVMGLKDIREAHIKRIAKAGNTVRGMQDFTALGDAASSMDINVFPSDPFEFTGFKHFYYAMCSAFAVKMYSRSHMGGPSVDEGAFDGLMAATLSSFRKGDYERLSNFGEINDVYNMRDSLGWVYDTIIKPLVSEHQLDEENDEWNDVFEMFVWSDRAGFSFFSGMRAVELAEFNVFWHKNIARISKILTAYDEQDNQEQIEAWAEKFPKATAKNLPALGKYRVIPLLNVEDLKRHGEALGDICIHSDSRYKARSIRGHSFCFSLQDEMGVIWSAFELDHQGELCQHEAFEGSTPDEDQKQAVAAYVAAIREGKIKPSPLHAEWQKKAGDFSFRQVYGHSELDPDRARFVVQTVLGINGLPKNMKRALQDHVNWSPDRIKSSYLYNLTQKPKL